MVGPPKILQQEPGKGHKENTSKRIIQQESMCAYHPQVLKDMLLTCNTVEKLIIL